MDALRRTLIVVSVVTLGAQATPTLGQYWQSVAQAAPWDARSGHASIVFQDMIFVMGGYAEATGQLFNDVWRSSDGEHWIEATASAPWAPRELLGAVVYQDRIWIMGGTDNSGCFNDVWCSTDGMNWEQKPTAPWAPRYGHGPLVFDDRIWVLGGAIEVGGSYVNDAWYTVDGEAWVQARADGDPDGFMPAASKRGAVFQDRMWLTGGNTSRGYTDEVYWSTNGVQWVLATDEPGWLSRGHHAVITFRGSLWLFGGYRGSGTELLNDVWRSPDGVQWFQVPDAQWGPRALHSALVHHCTLWVLGGHVGVSNDLADTWRLMTTGDLNCDGLVDFKDINPFILALTNPAQYAIEYPSCCD